MARRMKVSGSVDVPGVTPAEVYEQVSDPTRMRRWSPENTGAEVESGSGRLGVGDVFVGANERGGSRWQTRCRVVADRAVDLLDSRLTGGRTFAEFQERNIARTLAALHDDLAVPV